VLSGGYITAAGTRTRDKFATLFPCLVKYSDWRTSYPPWVHFVQCLQKDINCAPA